MEYMIISFSGAPGSGKSTIAQDLAKKLAWPRYYIGIIRRRTAKERGLTLAEYNKLGETDPSTDFDVDEYQKKLGEDEDNFIIEGRTSWFFIPHSLKIYLDVDPEIGAKRIFQSLQKKNDRNEDSNLKSWEDVLESNKKRLASDALRYQKYYKIDIDKASHYDLYLDTTNLTSEEVFKKVEEFVLKQGKI
jgi:predicted cytidylate kinase